MRFITQVGFSLLALAIAGPTKEVAIHETIAELPSGWAKHSSTKPEDLLELHIALKHPHQQYLKTAKQVSDPDSPLYGLYLNREQLQAALPNVDNAADVVRLWLQNNEISRIERDGDLLHVRTTVGQAESLLAAKFSWYQFQDAAPVIRTQDYSIPMSLKSNIDFIYPTIHFLTSPYQRAGLQKRQHLPPATPNCTNSVCPKRIQDAYQINYSPPDSGCSSLGIAGFLEQYGNHADLQSFLKQYGLKGSKAGYDFKEKLVNGGKNSQKSSEAGVEASLDLQYAMAFTNPIPVTYYSVGGRPPTQSQPGNKPVPANQSGNEPYIEFLNYLLKEQSPPRVISISYSDDEATVPAPYAQKVCSLFAQLAARGVSVLVASGDGGAAGSGGNSACTGPDGKKRGFRPTFPSSCPWVTSVGATINSKPDQPASFSSGGFSNYFGTPDWQKAAVAQYQKGLAGKHKAYYNSSGRGIPDVAAMGDDYLVVTGGLASPHDGTSASTPVFAAVVALLNDIRIRKGMPALGFLNPILYGKGIGGLSDVTTGSAGGCSDGDIFETGFEALKGWDASTGLGTPNFPKLKTLLA